jgi:hypothetical protein
VITHDRYGKDVLHLATNEHFKNWFVKEERAFEYPSGGIVAKLDGVIGEDCVVEVEACNEKQIRGGILDLVFHPRPKKLLIIIPVRLKKKPLGDIQQTYQKLLDALVNVYRPSAVGRVVVLKGAGNEPTRYVQEDSSVIGQALSFMKVRR